MSKNKRFGRGWKNITYVIRESQQAEALVKKEITKSLNGIKFYKNKIYVELVVHKPRGNIDAINFLDAIADCIKDVIKVDDKWFAVKELEWQIDAVNPRIEIRLYQPNQKDIKICSKCTGEFAPTAKYFGKNSATIDGLNSRCIPCIREINRNRAKLKRESK